MQFWDFKSWQLQTIRPRTLLEDPSTSFMTAATGSLTMPSPAPSPGANENWHARATELKAELMARKNAVTTISHPKPQCSLGTEPRTLESSVSPEAGSNAAAPTFAPASAPNTMAPLLHETDAQKLKQDLSEQVDQLIANEAPRAQPMTTTGSDKLLHDAPSAITHTCSTPTKPLIAATNRREKTAETTKTETLREHDPKKHQSTDGSKGHETVSSSKQDVDDPQPSTSEVDDRSGHVAKQGEANKQANASSPTSPKEETSKVRYGSAQRQSAEDSKDLKTSGEGGAKGIPVSSAPLRRTPIPETPKSGQPQDEASSLRPTTAALPVSRPRAPPQPATESAAPSSKDEAPPSALRDHKRNGSEPQNASSSVDPSRVTKGHEDESRRSTRQPAPTCPQPPARLLIHHRPHDPVFELDILASHDRDLKEWLAFTGWHNRDYRAGFLQRQRRLVDLDREKHVIDQERAELVSADEHALRTARSHSGSGRADDCATDYPPHNAGRELFSAPVPSSRKREYLSDCEDDLSRKTSRGDGWGCQRGSFQGGRDDYGQKTDYHDDLGEGKITNHVQCDQDYSPVSCIIFDRLYSSSSSLSYAPYYSSDLPRCSSWPALVRKRRPPLKP